MLIDKSMYEKHPSINIVLIILICTISYCERSILAVNYLILVILNLM